ncbi:MAG: hypothetical protein ACREPV_12985 [Lysobacter sp.]
MDAPSNETALADASSNPRDRSQVDAFVAPAPLIFYEPQTGELWVVPAEHAAAVEKECRQMDKLVYDLNEAKEAYLVAKDELLKAERAAGAPDRAAPQHPQAVLKAEQKLAQAEKNLQKAQKAIEDEFKPLGKLDETGGKITELIPIRQRSKRNAGAKTKPEKNGYTWARNWSYVRNDKVKEKRRKYPLNKGEQAKYQGQSGSFVKDGKIDTAKLGKQLTELETSASWKAEVGVQGAFLEDVNRSIDSTLKGWADGINADPNQRIEVGAEAQLLRYFAGAGLSANWNPKKGNVAVRADARAEFSLAEGKFTAAGYWPAHGGHMISMVGPKSGKTYEAGQIRLGLQLELLGTAGASACGQLGLEVDYSSLTGTSKAGLRGRPSKKPLSAKGLKLGRGVRDGAQVEAAADLFAGARASGEIKGLIEWNDPENKKFEALCKIGPGGQVQAGAGIGGQFRIDYNNGKFRLLVAGSVCLGVGAGGRLEFEVDAKQTFGFSRYLAYMLYSVGYEFVEIFADEAFDAWKTYSLWAVQNGKDIVEAIDRFEDNIAKAAIEIVDQLEDEAERVQLMNRVLANPQVLEYAPPETKGMILYQLTRHSMLTKTVFLPQNQGIVPALVETLDRRKESVLTVIRKARSKAEYRNILQHMTVDGSKEARDWKAVETQVQEFLDMGMDMKGMDEQMLDHGRSLAAIYNTLYNQPILGHPFMDNDQKRYLANAMRGDHDGYRVAGGYSPGPSMPTFERMGYGEDADVRYA